MFKNIKQQIYKMKTKKEELEAELTRLNALRKQVKEKLKALPVLDVGRWYWVHSSKWDDALIFYNGNEDSFGFSHSGQWTDYYNIGCLKTSPANQEDVNRIFINEAINRGLVNGVKINSLIDGDSAELNGDRYFFHPYPLYFNLGSRNIFANGKWATIIEQDKFAELKEAHRNGAVIQINNIYGGWSDVVDNSDLWLPNYKYRIKPEEKQNIKLRLGRKQQRVILDDNNFGHEVCVFHEKYKHLAPLIIELITNSKKGAN